MKHKKATKKGINKHGSHFCVTYIRTVSMTTIIASLIVFSLYLNNQVSEQYVLGASTSSLRQTCSVINIFCYIQNLFTKQPQSKAPSTSETIDTSKEVIPTVQLPTATPAPTLIPGYQSKSDSIFGFYLQYPKDWIAGAHLPAYYKTSGGITPGPIGTLEEQHSFNLHLLVPPAKIVNGGFVVTKEDAQKAAYGFSFLIEPNPQHLLLTQFITTVEFPLINQSGGGFGWTVTPHIYTKKYGANIVTVLETTRAYKGSNGFTTINGIYLAKGDHIFRFSDLPSINNPAWTVVDIIISSFKLQ